MIRILVAEHHCLEREGLQALLERETDLTVVGNVDSGKNAVKTSRELLPDVVIVDMLMPDLNGIETTRQILSYNPEINVIGLSVDFERTLVEKMIGNGARGFLLHDSAADELIQAIREVQDGQVYLSTKVTSAVIQDFILHPTRTKDVVENVLTPREREVLQMIAKGMTTRNIADHLKLSTKTIEVHRRNIMTKLKLDSLVQLTKYAIRQGMAELEE